MQETVRTFATDGDLVDPALTALYIYWAAKCAGRRMPSRADIDPSEIRTFLPDLFLAEIHLPLRFRLRLVGTRICERWGADPTGCWLDELPLDGARAEILEPFEQTARNGIVRHGAHEFMSGTGRYLRYRQILLPLSADGQSANVLLGCQKGVPHERNPPLRENIWSRLWTSLHHVAGH
jgi:hypothetical protein